MISQEKCPTCGATCLSDATSCSACGSALKNYEPALTDRPSPTCPDEEITLEIGVWYLPPSAKWLAARGSPLWITTNCLCFSGTTVKGDRYDIVIRLSDITRIYEEEYRQNILIKKPTLVIESGGNKYCFWVLGKRAQMGRDTFSERKSKLRRRTNNLISFIITQTDLMGRAGRPVTKDDVIQAYREKNPERVTPLFKAHLVIFVVVNLLLLAVILTTNPEIVQLYFLITFIWGLLLVVHYIDERLVFIT